VTNPICWTCKNCSYKSAADWTLCHTIQHMAVLIKFPLNLQTITISQACWVERCASRLQYWIIAVIDVCVCCPADRHRPYLMTRVQGTNDYINAVFVDVCIIFVLYHWFVTFSCSRLFYDWQFWQIVTQFSVKIWPVLVDCLLCDWLSPLIDTDWYWKPYHVLQFGCHLVLLVVLQKFWKLVKIWQSYRKFKGGNFFETQCIKYKIIGLTTNYY